MAFDNAPALGGHRSGCNRRFFRGAGSNMMFDSHRQEQQQQKEHLSNSAGRVHIPIQTETSQQLILRDLISILNRYTLLLIEIYQLICIDQKHHFHVCRCASHARGRSYADEEARK